MSRKDKRSPRYVSVPKAADCLGCSARQVYALLSEGALDAINISIRGEPMAQSFRVSVESIEKFKNDRKVKSDE
jgi:hypothetical protein